MSSTDDAGGVPTAEAPDTPPWAAGAAGRPDELYPVLSDSEIDQLRPYGEVRSIAAGTRLWSIGERNVSCFVVMSGALEILRREGEREECFHVHEAGSFSGETVTMSGRGSFVGGRARTDLEVVEIGPQRLRDLLAVEPMLGEKILQAFILRRMRMIAQHHGDILIIGDATEQLTASIREFLSRNGVPYRMVPDDDAPEPERPVIVCGEQRLARPTIKQVADCLGMTADLPDGAQFDVAVIGGGPSGLAAAVYAASEGLSVVVLEKCSIGGQAGSSSRIENYLGFPTGISGQALTGRGFLQAQKFGAEIAIAQEAAEITCGAPWHTLTTDCGMALKARTVVLATGAVYRQPQIEGLDRFEGTSVHYGASHIQGMMCRGEEVVIVGGGNSAGQAAVYLSSRARKVSIMVRGDGLAASMSQYLIRRIERTPNIDLLTHMEVEALEGDDRIDCIQARNNKTGDVPRLPASHLFLFIGAAPATGFLDPAVALDEKGFVRTGDALDDTDLQRAAWPLERKPYHLETSCPGIFAVGDVRSGSVKRVASAVGDGSVCISFVHKALDERPVKEAQAASDD
jgi:thioredoxin reductase (NADPH)